MDEKKKKKLFSSNILLICSFLGLVIGFFIDKITYGVLGGILVGILVEYIYVGKKIFKK